MRFHEEAARDRYDAIVIGSGLGGLTSAALLARAGRSVLIVERHDRPGGYAHAFRRRGYRFDSAVHLVSGCEPVPFEGGGVLHDLLSELGVRDRCDFVRVDPAYRVEWRGLALDAPCELDRFAEAHAERFPSEAKGIRGFLEDCLDDNLVLAPGDSCGRDYQTFVRICFTAAPPEITLRGMAKLAARLQG